MELDNLVKELDNVFMEPQHLMLWQELKSIIQTKVPQFETIHLGDVYLMKGKKGTTVRVVATKSNTKTWVMYETMQSVSPGARWMVHKSWCTKNNIKRDSAQSYVIPEGVTLK